MGSCSTWSCRFVLVQALIAAGLLLGSVGCARDDASEKASPQGEMLAAVPAHTAPAASAKAMGVASAPTVSAMKLDDFQKALERKFDRSQITKQVLPQGVLYIPNGFAAHAVVAVKNPDGTVSQQCISSATEARALVSQMREGAGQ